MGGKIGGNMKCSVQAKDEALRVEEKFQHQGVINGRRGASFDEENGILQLRKMLGTLKAT